MRDSMDTATVNIDGAVDRSPVVPLRKTDAQIAQELRDEMAPHLAALCKVLDKARANGLRTEFNLMPDAFGRHNPPYVTITKAL